MTDQQSSGDTAPVQIAANGEPQSQPANVDQASGAGSQADAEQKPRTPLKKKIVHAAKDVADIAIEVAPGVAGPFSPAIFVSAAAIKEAKEVAQNSQWRHKLYLPLDKDEKYINQVGDLSLSDNAALQDVVQKTLTLNAQARPQDIEATRLILNYEQAINDNHEGELRRRLEDLDKIRSDALADLNLPRDPVTQEISRPEGHDVPDFPVRGRASAELHQVKNIVRQQLATVDIVETVREKIEKRVPPDMQDGLGYAKADDFNVIKEINEMNNRMVGMSDDEKVEYQDRFIRQAANSASPIDKKVAIAILIERNNRIADDDVRLAMADVQLTGYDSANPKDKYDSPPFPSIQIPSPSEPGKMMTYAPRDTYAREVERLRAAAEQAKSFKSDGKIHHVSEPMSDAFTGPLPTPEAASEKQPSKDKVPLASK